MKAHIENKKDFEENATKRFLNQSATKTWPEGTTQDDYETEKEVKDRLKINHERKK